LHTAARDSAIKIAELFADRMNQAPVLRHQTPFCLYNVCMVDERALTLRQLDQIRGDLYAVQDELECMKAQFARLPTRSDLARAALGIIFATTMLTTLSILWFEAGWRF
jgi:hypothetical protein